MKIRNSLTPFLLDGDKVRVTGWGKTRAKQKTGKVFSRVLQQLQLPIANNLCDKVSKDIDQSIQLCAGGKRSMLSKIYLSMN